MGGRDQFDGSFWTPRSLQRSVGGRWLTKPDRLNAPLAGVSIDTRTIEQGELYIAIRGDRYDGHDYLEQAVHGGAAVLVVSDEAKAWRGRELGVGVLCVKDSLVALQDLARTYRDCLRDGGVRVVAVTGSNGKTTTRHMIYTVLSSGLTGTQSPKSFNNHIGVPLTLLAADLADDFVVVEVGSSGEGEVLALGGIVRPDVAVITQIGSAHLDGLGSREGVAREKGALLGHIQAGGLAVVPGDEPLLDEYVEGLSSDVSVVRFGDGLGCDVGLIDCMIDSRGSKVVFSMGGEGSLTEFRLPMLGRHNGFNALAALSVGEHFGLDMGGMTKSLSEVIGVPMRLDVSNIGGAEKRITLINDAYNANPDSVLAGIDTLVRYPLSGGGLEETGGGRVLILGDMCDLGMEGERWHRRIGEEVVKAATSLRQIVLVGSLSMCVGEVIRTSGVQVSIETFGLWDASLPAKVAKLIRVGDVVLIKASRAMGLERLIPDIKEVVMGWNGVGDQAVARDEALGACGFTAGSAAN